MKREMQDASPQRVHQPAVDHYQTASRGPRRRLLGSSDLALPHGTSPRPLLDLQRTIGNQATAQLLARRIAAPASGSVVPVQRQITVRNVDFDPTAPRGEAFTHGYIDDVAFFQNYQEAIKAEPLFDAMKHRAKDAIDRVKEMDFEGRDVETVARLIAERTQATFKDLGFTAWTGPKAGRLITLAKTALGANVRPASRDMDAGERSAFDQLVTIVGEDNMSRSKGTPTALPVPSLPALLGPHVSAVYAHIRGEHRSWTTASWKPEFVSLPRLQADIAGRMKANHYQGNHTNKAGWLPPVTPPSQLIHPDTDANIRLRAWGALGMGVSAYLEFNLPGSISRLVFDYVNGHVYVTAHYKWRKGFNPFFKVTGLPPL